MSISPRQAVSDALFNIEKNGEYSTKAVLDTVKNFEPRDRAFVNEALLGILRNKIYIDFIIQSFSKLKLKKISPYVLQILRTGAYQILFMDKIPVSAACNEAVKIAEKKARSAKGFINGILRNIARNIDNLPKPEGEICQVMSVKYSCPLWLVKKIFNQFGREKCEEILSDSLKPHPTFIRANSLKITADDLAEKLASENIIAEKTEVPQCLRISGAIDVYGSELYKNGYYTLQNINSQRTALVLEPKPNETIIDVCSAPGGKTTHIAELMENQGRVVAFDIHKHKISLIQKTAERLGISCVEAICHNSENTLDEYKESADRVLADVPCSGIGVIHRKPDIKYNRCEEDITALTQIQAKILNSAAAYVKVGGTLVYSTCTILKEENEDIVSRFLEEHKDFEKDFENLYLASDTEGSGFYICRMVRKK